ncbi:MAG: geranylgeranyl reductase family protein [Chryseolinea sp.]
MKEKYFDVIISGAGPAGCATALSLKDSGLSVALLDKATFPRDKICGDALSVDVINQLYKLSPSLGARFASVTAKVACYGVKIFSPDSGCVDIPFVHENGRKPGYICTRKTFDNFMVEEVKRLHSTTLIENCEVIDTCVSHEEARVITSNGTYVAKLIVGAEGAQSVIAKKLMSNKIDRKHYSAGLRMYYGNVKGFHSDNYIELYFFKDILPGYLWIFPLPDDQANVGIGMLSSEVAARKVNLQQTLQRLLTTHPLLQERFRYAVSLETVKGFGLPLGSVKKKISGNRFLLTGDSASLIDPFTGEGIANAIRSGRIAGNHAIDCFQSNQFSETFNNTYDQKIYASMQPEFLVSSALQKLCRYPRLFNTIVKKANRSKLIHNALIDALAHVEHKRWLLKPSFYYHLLFA